jgi:hypothetical protein
MLIATIDIYKPRRTSDADKWKEEKHPRGQPGNKGEFAKTSGGGGSSSSEWSVPLRPNYDDVNAVMASKVSPQEKIRRLREIQKKDPDVVGPYANGRIRRIKEQTGVEEETEPEKKPQAAPTSANEPTAEPEKPKPSPTGGKPTVTGTGSNRKKIEEGINRLPPAVAEQLKHIKVVTAPTVAHGATAQHSYSGLYSYGETPTVTVPDSFLVRGSPQKLRDPIGITVHELGHALDHQSNWQLGKEFGPMVDEAAKSMSKFDREYAEHSFSNDKEKFAELFRLAFSRDGSFEKRQAAAERIFAKPLAAIRERFK